MSGRIIPHLKPGKPTDQSKSVGPITLLSAVAELVERLLPPNLTNIQLAEHQHGFWKGRSTLTVLSIISHANSSGLNKPKPYDRTMLVALDLTEAFDTVPITTRLQDLQTSAVPQESNDDSQLTCEGESTHVKFGGRSRCRKMIHGLPQVGVLSPILSNLYMSKLPLP